MKYKIMKHILNTPFYLVFILSLFTHLCGAKEYDIEKAKKTFTCFTFTKIDKPTLFFKYKKDFYPIQFSVNTRSRLYPLDKGELFTVFTEKRTEENKIEYIPYAQVTIPSNKGRVLFIFIPVEDQPHKIIGIDDSLENFPPGSFKFYNFTKNHTKSSIDGIKSTISPNDVSIVKPRISSNGGMLPFFLGVGNEIVYETRLWTQPNDRQMIFIFPETRKTKRRPVRVQFLSELIAPKPKKEVAQNTN